VNTSLGRQQPGSTPESARPSPFFARAWKSRARAPGVATLLLVALSSLAGTSCIEEQRYDYVGEQVMLTPATPVAYVTEDDDPVYRVDREFLLGITPPKAADLTRLTAEAQGKMLPFPRLPWVRLHDLELQLDYALENHSDQALTALITINGINEFVYYAPGPENLHQWERRVALTPGQRVTGIVTELELDELAVDLATVVNGATNSNLVVTRMSQSSRDPRVQSFIPSVIPGLVGVRAGLETGVAVDLTLEISIRLQDHGDRATKRGDTRWDIPPPAAFVPIVPEED
jgi:hypothetical protein